MKLHSLLLPLVVITMWVPAVAAQMPEFPNGEPRDLAEAEALLWEKEQQLAKDQATLKAWERRPQQIKEIGKSHEPFRKRLATAKKPFQKWYSEFEKLIMLHKKSLPAGNWQKQIARVSMDKRKGECDIGELTSVDYYGPWNREIKKAFKALEKARAAYYRTQDAIDAEVIKLENQQVYFPGKEITSYADFDQAYLEARNQYRKEGTQEIRRLKGTRHRKYKDGAIHKLKAEIDRLRGYIDEWRHTGVRPGSTPILSTMTPSAPPPAPPIVEQVPPQLVGQIVEATPSGPIGSAPNRRCVWRFYILLEDRAGRGVELRFADLSVEPSRQDTNAKRYHHPPSHRYAWKKGEVDHVGGWLDKATEQWRHGGELPPEKRAAHIQEALPMRLALGPYFLMVWEDKDFLGKYEATFTATERDGSGVSTTVTFKPPRPPWMAITALDVRCDEDDLIGPAGSTESCFRHFADQYHEYFEVVAPDLPPGLHRLELAFDPGRTYSIWARVPEGESGARFKDNIPIPSGRFTVTLSVTNAPQFGAITLQGRCDPARDSIEYLNKALAKFNRGNFASGHQRGDALLEVARRRNMAGQWAEAMNAATEAASLLPEEKSGGTSWTVGGSGGQSSRYFAVKEQVAAAYHLGDPQRFHTLARQLWEYEAKQNGPAGSCVHLAARRLLRMGVHPDQVRQLMDLGNQYYYQSGSRNPPKTPWFPM